MFAPKKMKRSLLAGAGIATISALILGGTAWAQQVDEIIVTAQKRKENIQEVPISISTLPAERVEDVLSGGGDILSLANRVPGLYAESSNGRTAPRFYIRGLGNQDFALQATQPVSIIMNDVVMANTLLKSFPIFDVEQVEVLRGPQGSLFGRNTPAGIVKFTTRKPTDDLQANMSASIGTYFSTNIQGGVGGSIIRDKLKGRISGIWLHRNDYVDNRFTGERNALGGFEDKAARLLLEFTPTSDLSIGLDVRKRAESGTATLFRANILTTGSNQLNSNFVPDAVYYDGGAGNPQHIESEGLTVSVKYDLGDMVLTSITAFDEASGDSRGDIDGGFGGFFAGQPFGPGFIPFGSDTGNEYYTSQYTEELRLASDTNEALKWQIGGFFFRSKMKALTIPGFVAPSTLVDHKKAWAVFGQASYQMDDANTITAGLRYTKDKADLFVFNAPAGPIPDTFASAGKVSGDISIDHKLDETKSVYARFARGFRGPSIQGRSVAFFGSVSKANPETIDSAELGFKSLLMDGRVRFNTAAYYYRVKDQQFTAVGGAGNFIGLVNADKGIGYGIEGELDWAVTDNLSLNAGLAINKTEIQDKNLAVAPCGSAGFQNLPGAGQSHCTVLDPLDANGNALIDGNPFPNAPEYTANFTADYRKDIGNDMELLATLDGTLQGLTNVFLYDSTEFKTNGNFELGGRIGIAFEHNFEISVFARNLTNEHNLMGGIDFNNNTGFVTEPRIIGVSLKAHN